MTKKLSNSKSKSQVKLQGNCKVKKSENKDKIYNNSADRLKNINLCRIEILFI